MVGEISEACTGSSSGGCGAKAMDGGGRSRCTPKSEVPGGAIRTDTE